MAKLGKVNTDQPIEEAAPAKKNLPNEVTIEDAQGRKIVVAKPPYLRKLRLLAAVGDELSSNRAYMDNLFFINWVKSIDGVPVFEVSTMSEIEALVNRLEDDGFSAIIKGIMQMRGISSDSPDKEEQVDPLTKK